MSAGTPLSDSERQAQNAEDIALVEEAIQGSRRAQREIVKRYQGPIFAYIYRWMHNRADAEDLTQDVFIKMFNKLETYSRQSSFRAWLYRIARNRTIDHLRRKRLQTVDIENVTIEDKQNPEEEYDKAEQKNLLEKAISSLPELYREVLLLRHRDELSYEEITDATDLPLGTVKARLHRGRTLLRKKLLEVKLL